MNVVTYAKRVLCLLALVSISVLAKPLITDKEAKLPAAKGELKTRGISRGPGIKVLSPSADGAAVSSPFDLKIQFESRGGNKIDPKSVKVLYLKSPAVDLTDRMKAAISESGIDFQKAEVPSGDHLVKVIVKDADGRESTTVINLTVQK